MSKHQRRYKLQRQDDHLAVQSPLPLRIGTLNTRSLQKKEKRDNLLLSLTQECQAIVLSETWLNFHIDHEYEKLHILQSSLGTSKQVAIVTSQPNELIPIFEDLWDNCFLAARLEIRKQNRKHSLYIIGCYWPPSCWRDHVGKVEAVVEFCRNRNGAMEIVVAGDLNLPLDKAREVAQSLNLHLAQPQTEQPTHKNSATQRYNQLDYIMSSAQHTGSRCATDNQWSDHNLLSSLIHVPAIPDHKKKAEFFHMLKKDLAKEDIARILNHPDWPRRSFLEVAKFLNLTQRIRKQDREDGGIRTILKKRQHQLNLQIQQTELILKQYSALQPREQQTQQSSTVNEILRIWDQGAAQLFLRSLNHPIQTLQMNLLEQIRCTLPKQFFQAVSSLLKVRKKSLPCRSFRSCVVEGRIVTAQPIGNYIKELFHHDRPEQPFALQQTAPLTVTRAEVEASMKKLNNRATGIDGLSAAQIKTPELQQQISTKILDSFNKWLKNNRIPRYLKTGRLLNLSKDESRYPAHGQIRTISMGCSLTKILEGIILERLITEISELKFLHPQQRGFQRGKNTLHNIEELEAFIRQAKIQESTNRSQKIPVKYRQRQLVFFIDLKRAFDSVNRQKLIEKLYQYGITPQLVNAIALFLQDTHLQLEQDSISTRIEVPQGSKLSPTLFLIYINDLVVKLNQQAHCLAFADDLVVICKSKHQLSEVIDHLDLWAAQNEIHPNPKKSAVIITRLDRRTPPPTFTSFRSYPVLTEYKYLGVTISDSLDFSIHKEKLSKLSKAYRQTVNQTKASKLPPLAQYQAWTSFFLSKAQYSSYLLSALYPKIYAQMGSFIYQSVRTLLHMKQLPHKDKLFLAATGAQWQQFMDDQQTRTQLLLHPQPDAQKPQNSIILNLKRTIASQAIPLVKLLAHCTYPQSQKLKQLRKCLCGSVMSHHHLFECPSLNKIWDQSARHTNLTSGEGLKSILKSHPSEIHQHHLFSLIVSSTNALFSRLNTTLSKPDELPRVHLTANPRAKAKQNKPKRHPSSKQKVRGSLHQPTLYDFFRVKR